MVELIFIVILGLIWTGGWILFGWFLRDYQVFVEVNMREMYGSRKV